MFALTNDRQILFDYTKSDGCLGLLWFIIGKTDDRLGRVMMGE